MFSNPRVAHIRFMGSKIVHKSSHDKYSRIVTVVWNYHPRKNILTYGATVYTPHNRKDKWVKRDHYHQAQKRYNYTPVIVRFDKPVIFSSVAMDRYIALCLIYRFSTESLALDHVNHISGDVNLKRKYDPNFRLVIRESKDQQNKPNRSCCNWSSIVAFSLAIIVSQVFSRM